MAIEIKDVYNELKDLRAENTNTSRDLYDKVDEVKTITNSIDRRLVVVETKINNGRRSADWISIAKAVGLIVAAGAAAAVGGASAIGSYFQ